MYKIMTPGPTQVAENAFSTPTTKLLSSAERESSDLKPPVLP